MVMKMAIFDQQMGKNMLQNLMLSNEIHDDEYISPR